MNSPLGIYIHIPFCVRKCNYCDFTSLAHCEDAVKNRYVTCLLRQIELASCGQEASSEGVAIDGLAGRTVDSVFLGGGTPSLLSVSQIRAVLDKLRQHFRLSDDCEITMEANPGTVNRETLRGYRSAGINRLSFGVQSMDPQVLNTLGRIHRVEDVEQSVAWARQAGFDNLNLDLMFGIPGQSLECWEDTLSATAGLNPEHISFYSLQVEEGTAIYDDIKYGRLIPLTDEQDREMYHRGLEFLRREGYEQYEISNGARPGYACRHNIKYWTLQEYAGFGLSAHGFLQGIRHCNGEDLEEYMGLLEEGRSPLVWFHPNTLEETASEFVFTGLRLTEGIDLTEFQYRFGVGFAVQYASAMEELLDFERQGFVKLDRGRLRLTERGMDISNRILSLFV